ncbi:MAG: hypothetical protein DI530_10200, partial [Sphingomonas sp.]
MERRLEFIEFRLSWEGGVRRSDIRRAFSVSEPQALSIGVQKGPPIGVQKGPPLSSSVTGM